MSAKFATRQNLQMEREKSASIANSKFARDAVFKSLYLDRNRWIFANSLNVFYTEKMYKDTIVTFIRRSYDFLFLRLFFEPIDSFIMVSE